MMKHQHFPSMIGRELAACPFCYSRAKPNKKRIYKRRVPARPLKFKCPSCCVYLSPAQALVIVLSCKEHGLFLNFEKNGLCPSCYGGKNVLYDEVKRIRGDLFAEV